MYQTMPLHMTLSDLKTYFSFFHASIKCIICSIYYYLLLMIFTQRKFATQLWKRCGKCAESVSWCRTDKFSDCFWIQPNVVLNDDWREDFEVNYRRSQEV